MSHSTICDIVENSTDKEELPTQECADALSQAVEDQVDAVEDQVDDTFDDRADTCTSMESLHNIDESNGADTDYDEFNSDLELYENDYGDTGDIREGI